MYYCKMEKGMIEHAIYSQPKLSYWQETYDIREKKREDIQNPKLEINPKSFERKLFKEFFSIILKNISNTSFFNPIHNFYSEELSKIPEAKLYAMGQLGDESIDIWTFILSDDIKIRHKIARIHVSIMRLWSHIPFEFMTIPIKSETEIQEFLKNKLKNIHVFTI